MLPTAGNKPCDDVACKERRVITVTSPASNPRKSGVKRDIRVPDITDIVLSWRVLVTMMA